jgi:hypothetical protein
MATRLKYIGNGAFIAGVPTCNLTTEQAKKFGIERLIASGLYIENQPKAKTNRKPAEHIEEDLWPQA